MWVGAVAGLALAVNMFLNRNQPPTPAVADRPSSGSFVVSGAVVLGSSFTKDDQGGCAGTGTHADVVEGAAVVVVTAGAGFGGGELAVSQALDDGTCRFSFSVNDVPAGEGTYVVMIGGQDVRNYSEEQLTAGLVNIRLD
ncbi:hypothetical protein [Asanoa iriomotensis]|uniref:Uncharacterized protein n=1 Tax=Asanoa iriomotensis TaxID=234613 RepID=A0ABQ4C477_9ACTN|nr:hypothetical protein [Asanoa iriomotensis]GIF57567.1 hypothetical protein Air01nite_36620 [Asanoa iriomotensis]